MAIAIVNHDLNRTEIQRLPIEIQGLDQHFTSGPMWAIRYRRTNGLNVERQFEWSFEVPIERIFKIREIKILKFLRFSILKP